MLQARAELAEWLETFPGHPLEEQVRIDLADALQRLADSDLSIARFYRKVQSAAGFEFHARRALDTAREAGNEAQITEAEALLAQASEALEAAP
jgi:outer membrane protein assembly factor BamD (BamD/ComL family)